MFLSENLFLKLYFAEEKNQLFLILANGQWWQWPWVYVLPDTIMFHTCPSYIQIAQVDPVALGQGCLGKMETQKG